jgi:hypothetical protein
MKPIVLVVLLGGCSFMFSRSPDPPRPASPPCQPSYLAPGYDTLQALGGAAITVWALGHAEGTEADTFGAVAAVTGAVTAVWTASAMHGFRMAERCEKQRYLVGPVEPPAIVVPVEEEIIEEEVEIQRRRTIRTRPILP